MEIKTKITRGDKTFDVIYKDIKNEDELDGKKVSSVHAYCFYKDKLVIVYSSKKNRWTPPGGGVEEGELLQDAIRREVQEESNMKILEHRFIGFQDIVDDKKVETQTRSVCIVEPYGEFVSDPDDGEITEIKLIDPRDYKKYFDWGDIGEHIMESALKIKDQMYLDIK